MSAQHTPGPWVPHEQGEANEWCLLTAEGGRWVISFRQNGELMPAKQRANAERIVACVNACEGIADPANVIPSLLRGNERIPALEAARAERDVFLNLLLETLQPGAYGLGSTLAQRIAKATGSAS